MDASLYTEDSYQAFQEAYDAAAAVAENPDALEEDVAEAVRILKQGVENLKQVEPQEPENPSDTDNNGTPENPKKPEAVKTGDTANIGVIVGCMAVALAVAGIVLVYKRKREQ